MILKYTLGLEAAQVVYEESPTPDVNLTKITLEYRMTTKSLTKDPLICYCVNVNANPLEEGRYAGRLSKGV